MKLDFKNQKMLLVSVNARSELHGEEREPAGDIGLEVDLSNDVLGNFHSSLKETLYCFDDAKSDLIDQTKRKEEGYLPHLRFAKLGPLKWEDEVDNVSVSIRVDSKRTITLAPAKINKFFVTPKDGGTVTLEMRIQAHPDEKAFGALSVLVQQQVEVTVKDIVTPQKSLPLKKKKK